MSTEPYQGVVIDSRAGLWIIAEFGGHSHPTGRDPRAENRRKRSKIGFRDPERI